MNSRCCLAEGVIRDYGIDVSIPILLSVDEIVMRNYGVSIPILLSGDEVAEYMQRERPDLDQCL